MMTDRPGRGPRQSVPRGRASLVGAVGAGSVAVGAMWLPWYYSGSIPRNSFGFFRAAQVLGLERITPFRIAWFLLPSALLVAVALIGLGARRSGLVIVIGVGLILAAAGALSSLGLGPAPGSAASSVAGTSGMVLGIAAFRRSPERGGSRRTESTGDGRQQPRQLAAPSTWAPERRAPERWAPERWAPERWAPERRAPERRAPERR